MTNREYLIKLLEESRVKAYTKNLGYTNDHLIDEALRVVTKYDLSEDLDHEAAEDHTMQQIKNVLDSGIVHEDARESIPLVTSVDEPIILEETGAHQNHHPDPAPVAKKKNTKRNQC